MDFGERLQRAVERGQRTRETAAADAARAQLTEEQLRTLHAQSRVELSDHIELCLQKVTDAFPGFDLQSVVTTDGFGAKISRDDLRKRASGPGMDHLYSHLELLVRSYSPRRLLEVTARGAIANREVLTRSFYQPVDRLDLEVFRQQVDQWVLEYAEKFAAT